MSKRGMLWTAFAVVHVGVAVLGWVLPNQPMGDVYLVYEMWATAAVAGDGIAGVDEPFVYPQLALVPMVLAKALSWLAGYIVAWAVMVTAVDAVAFAVLVGRGRSRGRVVAAWFWLAFAALLGPVGMYRIDAVTVPLAVVGMLWLVRRPVFAAALLAAGAWMKVWPAAVIAAAVVVLRRRAMVAVTTIVVSLAVVGAVAAMGGLRHVLGFVGAQTGRGLQLEAPVSMLYLWQAAAGVRGSFIFYDPDILTFQVTGPGVDGVIAIMTPLMALAVLAVVALGALGGRRKASVLRLLPPLALALVLVLIVFNKVGSPQFQTWLVAPLVLWLATDRRQAALPALVSLVIAALTQAVYPITYDDLLTTHAFAVTLLTVRNLLLMALLALTVARLGGVVAEAGPRRDAGTLAARRPSDPDPDAGPGVRLASAP